MKKTRKLAIKNYESATREGLENLIRRAASSGKFEVRYTNTEHTIEDLKFLRKQGYKVLEGFIFW